MRVVLDTSVIVAGARSARGASRLLYDWIENRKILAVISIPLVFEYETLLRRQIEDTGWSEQDVVEFLDRICDMTMLSIQIPESTLEELTRIAASENSTVDRLVGEVLDHVAKSAAQRNYLKERAARGRLVDFQKLLDKIPDVPPVPGDELPESLRHSLQRRTREPAYRPLASSRSGAPIAKTRATAVRFRETGIFQKSA
jgi:hypothetical protein